MRSVSQRETFGKRETKKLQSPFALGSLTADVRFPGGESGRVGVSGTSFFLNVSVWIVLRIVELTSRATPRSRSKTRHSRECTAALTYNRRREQMHRFNGWALTDYSNRQGFLSHISPIDGRFETSPETTSVQWRPLNFFEQTILVRVTDRTWPEVQPEFHYLACRGDLLRLNGRSEPVYEVASQAPIRISEDNVLDYLSFFCFFVRGPDGPFLIVEGMDNPYLPRNMDGATREVLSEVVQPARHSGTDERGCFLCDATVFYSNGIFSAQFAVHPGGPVEMLDDQPLAGELPCSIKVPPLDDAVPVCSDGPNE
jgi:hypothetical protein